LIYAQALDFHGNWPDGLNRLLTLFNKTDVLRAQSQAVRDASRWIDQVLAGPQEIVQEPQAVISNWFAFDSLPSDLNFFRVPIPPEKIWSCFESFSYPVFPYRDMIATFASLEDVDTFLPDWHVPMRAHEIPLAAVLNSEPHSLVELNWPDASRMLSYLIRTAWDNAMRQKGLYPYVMANGRQAWYPANGYNDKHCTSYADFDGVMRRRKLVGYSAKRKVYWNFALAAYPFIGRQPHMLLKAHVPFSEDGKRPLVSVKHMHRLRRSFCRSWWNDRWRDLLLAYMAQIAEENGALQIPVGSEQMIQVCSRPQLFESPVSVFGIGAALVGEDETDEELDRLADDVALDIDEDPDEAFEDDEIADVAETDL